MNELIIKENIKIEDMIYEIRGKQVMMDSDLAMLYECANGTKSINLAVKRNINRFPDRFAFQLTNEEYYKILRFHFETLELKQGQYSKYLPYVFTEEGVAMLATILKTKVAEEISIKIMDAFVMMKKYISLNDHNKRINNIETKLIDYDNKFDEVFSKLDKSVNNHIFFEGQIYDAYSLMMDILIKAKEEIIIIDNYAGKKLFDLIKDIKVNIKIYSKEIDKKAVNKYNKQYSNIELIKNDSFHDRFIILDRKILYHSGSSFKDLGKRCFAISLIEDRDILKNLLNYLNG